MLSTLQMNHVYCSTRTLPVKSQISNNNGSKENGDDKEQIYPYEYLNGMAMSGDFNYNRRNSTPSSIKIRPKSSIEFSGGGGGGGGLKGIDRVDSAEGSETRVILLAIRRFHALHNLQSLI